MHTLLGSICNRLPTASPFPSSTRIPKALTKKRKEKVPKDITLTSFASSIFLWDDAIPSMAAPPSLTLLLFLASSISFILMLVFLYIKKRRRRSRREEEHEDSTAAWLAVAAPPPPPPPQMEGKEEAEAEAVSGEEKRRKKRGKKKRKGLDGGEDGSTCSCPERDRADGAGKVGEGGKVGDLPFPFSSFASATQRKIKVQYDELVRSNQAKALTMAQVGQFVNCLVEARNGLQHKSEIIQRSFKIKKALLFKADRSSFDRLCQQIYKLEAEQKRLEEDAAVYNLLQEQLKLSPAYKTMLEVGASMELKGPRDQAMEFSDISFEELLAQEKKDSFWQRNGRLRSSAS